MLDKLVVELLVCIPRAARDFLRRSCCLKTVELELGGGRGVSPLFVALYAEKSTNRRSPKHVFQNMHSMVGVI